MKILDKNFNPGAFRDRPDDRDYRYEDIVFGTPKIDWKKGFNVEKELGIKLKVEDQNGSSSCVGESYGKYTEVINFVETGKLVNHSPKSIYEQIYLPQGGAYLRDGAKAIVKGGIALEKDLPSYDNGDPPSEKYMRSQMITPEIRQKMKVYQAKEYRSIGSANADLIAHAIMNNWGAVSGASGDNKGWKNWIVKPPTTSNTWNHAIFYIGFGKDSKGRYFDFINSWSLSWGGKNGYGRMYFDEYDMPHNTFSVWTLVDKKNLETVIELTNDEDMLLLKAKEESHIYLIRDNKKIMLIDMPTYNIFDIPFEEVTKQELEKYEDGGTIIWTSRKIS